MYLKVLICLCACVLGLRTGLPAQSFYEHVWIFGRFTGMDLRGNAPATISSSFDFILRNSESAASVCAPDGSLLFYTNGEKIWNRNHQPMDPAAFLTPTPLVVSSSTQGALIVPMPDSLDKYYVFMLTSSENGRVSFPFNVPNTSGMLFYSVVDMSGNGGLGIVSRKGILVDTGLTEKMISFSGTDCNVWVLVKSWHTDEFRAWNITANGISATPVVSRGGDFPPRAYLSGVMRMSPDRTRLAVCVGDGNQADGGLELFDIDVASGTVSNGVVLLDDAHYYNALFSPDNSRLYANRLGVNRAAILQYDLSLADINAIRSSETRLTGLPNPSQYSSFKTARDGQIYYIDSGRNIGVIRQPNLQGLACNPQPGVVTMDLSTAGVVNFPADIAMTVMQPDTVYVDTVRIPDICFRNEFELHAGYRNGRHYIWDDATRGASRTVHSRGVYRVGYFTDRCTWQVETFDVPVMRSGIEAGVTPAYTCGRDSLGAVWFRYAGNDTIRFDFAWINDRGDTLASGMQSRGDTLRGLASGSYRLFLSDRAHCDTLLFMRVPLEVRRPLLGFDIRELACAGDTLIFSNTSAGLADADSFLWDFGDGYQSRELHPRHVYPSAGTYEVSLRGWPCYDTLVRRTIVVDEPVMVDWELSDHGVCAGTQVRVHPSVLLVDAQIRWHSGDAAEQIMPFPGGGFSYIPGPGEGMIPLVITTIFRACPEQRWVDSVAVWPLPVADLGGEVAICPEQGETLRLENLAAADGLSFLWSDGSIMPFLVVRDHGTYALTVISPEGCMASDTLAVTLSCHIGVPNVFTPDGNGVNDYFFPRNGLTAGLLSFRMEVYNRWGQQVYATRDLAGRGWDGSLNGTPQPEGVYVYYIQVVKSNGAREQLQGNVTLLR